MRFSPSGDLTKPYEFATEVVGGAVPKNFFPAVEKGIQESVGRGPLAAYPVVGVKAVLYDGSYHPVDSSEMAFKTAAIRLSKRCHGSRPRSVGAHHVLKGYRAGCLYRRHHGRSEQEKRPGAGHDTHERRQADHRSGYSHERIIRLLHRSAFHDRRQRGLFYEFARYEQAPSDVQEKEVAARAAKVAENNAED